MPRRIRSCRVLSSLLVAASLFLTNSDGLSQATIPISNQDLSSTAMLGIGGPGVCETLGNIEVHATAGADLVEGYTQLNLAFAAINIGTHQGNITIDVCGNTSEPNTGAVLNSGSIGLASYTAVTIRPVGGARIIEGSTLAGTAVIKLDGADNVTIDGRQGGLGTARDLTVRNNSTASATAAIWLGSLAAGNGATQNTIRNLEVSAGTDATSSSTNQSFGVAMCTSGSLSPTSNGLDNDNNSVLNNRVIKARYGVMTRSLTTNLAIGTKVSDNIVGPSTFGTDQIGKAGILMQGDTGATVSRNVVQSVGCLEAQACTGADRVGIGIGNESWSLGPGTYTSNNYTVTKNIIHDIIEETQNSAVGILLGTTGGGAATNNLVANNFVYNVRANGDTGEQAVGIGISGGHTDRVVFNSVSMTGDVDPGIAVAAVNYGSGIRIANASGATHANLTLMNNSIYMDLSSSSTPGVRFYAISGNSAAYSFGTGGENYNNYYINPSNPQLQTGGLGIAGGNTLTTEFATLVNWRTAYTTPQDANSIQANPMYISTTSDLHLLGTSPNIDAGVMISGIVDDIDGHSRPRGAGFDIGADEVVPSAASVSLGGRVVTADGLGIGRAVVTIEGGSLAEPLMALTGPFGYYAFEELPAGLTYVVTVSSKRFSFAKPVRVVTLDDQISDFDFVAEP